MLLYVGWVLIVAYFAAAMLVTAMEPAEDPEPTPTPTLPTTDTETRTETDIPGYTPDCDPDPTDDRIPENVSLPNCGDDMVFTDTTDHD